MAILQNQNAQYTYQRLKQLGYSDAQAAGIVGNLMQESTFNVGARNKGDGQDGTDSIGIGQWNSDRARNLQKFASATGRDVANIDTQIDFIHHELNGAEKRSGDRLRSATTPEQAAEAMISYERPAGFKWDNPRGGHGWDNRLRHANDAYTGWSGKELAAVQPAPQPDIQNVQNVAASTPAPVAVDKRPKFLQDIDNSFQDFKGKLGFEGKGDATTFLGMKIGGESGLAKALSSFGGGSDDAPLQVSALPVAGAKASAEPVNTGIQIGRPQSMSLAGSPSVATDPDEEMLKFKRQLSRRGGLGSLGGMYLG